MRPPEISFACPSCSGEVSVPLSGAGTCAHCGKGVSLVLGPALLSGGPVEKCPACGGLEIYVQRDFNQKAGLVVVVIGALFAPFTHYLSLVAAALLDAFLYMLLPEIEVCYRCLAHFRGFPRNPAHKPYDLHTAEQYSKGPQSPAAGG
jgi:DNA-directed RNA polymerase subunit RPC12/RpoP